MNNWMDLIACPACRGGLSLKVFVPRAALLAEEGVLTCQKCGMWYPITQGIPRLLIPGPLRSNDPAFLKKWKLRPSERGRRRSPDENDALVTQSQVQKVFAFKWKSQKDWGIHGGAAKFMRKWSFEKYGWKNDRDYQAFSKTKRVMLDAGCGLGREAMRMAASNDAARVVGLELSACVEEARAHADEKKLKNLLLVQGDIMYPPFKKSVFDFVYSEGVLHHTSNTRTAVQRMADLLGRGGEFAF